MPRQTNLMPCRDFRGKTSAVLTRKGTSVLLHLPTDEEDIISFLQIQLAGNLKGPLDCPCNCWKIREQRREKNAARTEMGWLGGRGGGGPILQSNISYAINPIWIDIRPWHTVKNKAKLLLHTVGADVNRQKNKDWERSGKKGTEKKERSCRPASVWLLSWGYSEQLLAEALKEADYRQSQCPAERQTDGRMDRQTDLTPSSVQLSPSTSTESRPDYIITLYIYLLGDGEWKNMHIWADGGSF